MDLTGTDLDVAVNALIGSMLQNGYLSDIQNAILCPWRTRTPQNPPSSSST